MERIYEATDILKVIPHRYPFILVDRVIQLEEGKRALGIKCVSGNEPFFQGHFPGNPVMPGVLILEAMAQVGAFVLLAMEENASRLPLFAGADKVRFRRIVKPGDVLELDVTLERFRGRVGRGSGIARVGQEVAAEAQILFALS